MIQAKLQTAPVCLKPGSVAHFQRELLSLPAGNSCQPLFLSVPGLDEQPAVLQR